MKTTLCFFWQVEITKKIFRGFSPPLLTDFQSTGINEVAQLYIYPALTY